MTDRLHDPDRLRRRRIEAGLSQKDLAAQARISVSHMSQIESGKQNPSPPVLGRLACALTCEIADLLPPATPTAAA